MLFTSKVCCLVTEDVVYLQGELLLTWHVVHQQGVLFTDTGSCLPARCVVTDMACCSPARFFFFYWHRMLFTCKACCYRHGMLLTCKVCLSLAWSSTRCLSSAFLAFSSLIVSPGVSSPSSPDSSLSTITSSVCFTVVERKQQITYHSPQSCPLSVSHW